MKEPQTIQPIRPCWHTRSLLSALVDGELTGWVRKYVQWHVAHCPRCLAALDALKQLSQRLRGLGEPASLAADNKIQAPTLSADRWTAMEAAWEKAERTVP
ncbi:MAG: zf-HC2 domain-containing protein [Capsulimonas sp.]|uniref:anti-sigma factor family protein n=1 Tax=Capsulimonas sp. TaxID=2494211 RepID=UPI0032657287